MASSAEQLERIAQGIEALGSSLRTQPSPQGVPSLPAQGQAPSAQGIGRAFPQKSQPEVPALPGSHQDAKNRGKEWFGHTAPGRFVASGLNAASDAFQKFKGGESQSEKTAASRRDNTSLAGVRGGVQSKSDNSGDMGKVVDLLGKCERHLEKLSRQAGKYGGQGGAKTQLESSRRPTDLFMRGGQTQMASTHLGDMGNDMASPSTNISLRSGGAGGGGANPRSGAMAKIAAMFGGST